MTQIERLIAEANKHIGIKENPPNSNKVIFNTAYYGREVQGNDYPWCMAFQWYIFREAGLAELFYGGKKTAYCNDLKDYAQKNSQWITSGYKPGDVALFDFSGARVRTQHTGLIVSVGSDTVETIEGNTGSGSEADGGQVQRRSRKTKLITGAYRPHYAAESDEEDENVKRYQKIDEIPANYRASVKKLTDSGVLCGDGSGLNLSEDMIRLIVIIDRAGAFDTIKKQ